MWFYFKPFDVKFSKRPYGYDFLKTKLQPIFES